MNNYKSQSILGIHYGIHSQGYELCSIDCKIVSNLFPTKRKLGKGSVVNICQLFHDIFARRGAGIKEFEFRISCK
ncbi:hypothetical protein LEP1GSC066_1273 [Leptospira sp. serovar Kenya str. Sh9]|nr:hypothetical protein LEP1GSC066_1273 [Leptospira sp. serovar Kenya str. Sh9]KGE22386.1 hypothetical protein IQ66_17450 [Leptospira borgpetersenii serovar Ballum]